MILTANDHLQHKRWPQRGDPKDDPLEVWERGRRLNMAHAPRGLARVPNHDEARYDSESQTVIFRRADRLVTCYSVRKPFITNDHGRAVREAVEAQFGPVRDSDMQFTKEDS